MEEADVFAYNIGIRFYNAYAVFRRFRTKKKLSKLVIIDIMGLAVFGKTGVSVIITAVIPKILYRISVNTENTSRQ